MPKNQELADIIFAEMAERLILHPIFEDYCGMDVNKGAALIRNHGLVVEDTERSFVVSYSIESEGSPDGISHLNLKGHAYKLPFLALSGEEALEDFLRTCGKIIGDVGLYFIEQTIPPKRERAA